MEIFKDDFTSNPSPKSKTRQNCLSLLKATLYSFYDSLLANYPQGQVSHLVMVVIESIELLYYPFSILTECAVFPNTSYYPLLFIVSTAIAFAYLVAVATGLLLIFCYLRKHSVDKVKFADRNNGFVRNCFSFFAFALNLHLMVFVFLIVDLCLAPLLFESSSSFINNPAVRILGTFIAVVATSLGGLTLFFSLDEELGSKLPWTGTPPLIMGINFAKKIVMAVAFNGYYDGTTNKYFVVACCAFSLIEIIGFVRGKGMARRAVELLMIMGETSNFAMCLLALAKLLCADFELNCPVLFAVGVATAGLLVTLLRARRREEVLYCSDAGRYVEEYVREVVRLVEAEKSSASYSPHMTAVLKHHCLVCASPECPFKIRNHYKKENTEDQDLLSHRSKLQANKYNSKQQVYILLNYLMKERVKSEKNAKYHILIAQLQTRYIGNNFQALYELQEAQDYCLSAHQEFSIVRLTNEIELRISESSAKEDSKSSFEEQTQLQESTISMHDLIGETAALYAKFWKELLKDNPSYSEFTAIGHEIARKLYRIQCLFKEITHVMKGNIKLHVVYTLFTYHVVKDSFLAHELYLETKQTMESYALNKMRGYSNSNERLNAGIVIVSGNKRSMGIVLNSNNELCEMLGYDKKSIVGQNVSMLMPELIAPYHNKFLKKSYASFSVRSVNRLSVLALHCEGHIVACDVVARLIPNLDRGIGFIGFMTRSKFADYFRDGENQTSAADVGILLLDKEMRVQSLNKVFLNFLGIAIKTGQLQKYSEADKKLDLPFLYPSVFSAETMEHLTSAEGLTCTLNFASTVQALGEIIPDLEEQRTLKGGMLVNVKLKKFSYLKGSLSYYVCTILFDASCRSDLLREKTSSENSFEYRKFRESDNMLEFNDAASVSNTSVSNTSQQSLDMRTVKDLKLRIRDNNDSCMIKFFRYTSYILLVALIAVYVGVNVFKRGLVANFRTGFVSVYNKYRRLDYAMSIVYDLYTIESIIAEKQAANSTILHDRLSFYYADLRNCTARLKQVQEELEFDLASSYFGKASNEFAESDALTLVEVKTGPGGELIIEEELQCSLGVAVRKVIGKITDILGNLDKAEESEKWRRDLDYVVYNLFYSVLPPVQDSSEKMAAIVADKYEQGKKLFVWVNITVACVTMAASLFLLPSIIKAHSGVKTAIEIFTSLSKEEVMELITCSEKYNKQLNNSLKELLKDFYALTFDNDRYLHNDTLNQSSSEIELGAKQGDLGETDSEEFNQAAMNEQLKVLERKRKTKALTDKSAWAKNKLIIEICIIVASIGIYFGISFSIKFSLLGDLCSILEVFDPFLYTKVLVTQVITTGMKDFLDKNISFVPYWGKETAEFYRLRDRMIENNGNREKVKRIIKKKLSGIANDLNLFNSEKACTLAVYYEERRVECERAYFNILRNSMESCIHELLLEIDVLYNQFYILLENNNTANLYNFLNEKYFPEVIDVQSVFLTPLLEAFDVALASYTKKRIQEILYVDTCDLIIFIVVISFVILVVLSLLLMGFKTSILRVRRMLGILPVNLIAKDCNTIKKLAGQVS